MRGGGAGQGPGAHGPRLPPLQVHHGVGGGGVGGGALWWWWRCPLPPRFTLELEEGADPWARGVHGFTLSPQPYRVRLARRQPGKGLGDGSA